MTNRKLYLHYLVLASIIALGAILRFWHLGLKPLWMDEVITTIFSLGKNYHDFPLDVVFPLHQVRELFTYQSGVSCQQISQNLASQSTHPPLFFCAMYNWLGWLSPLGSDWVTKLRSPSALLGVGTILAIYIVNRIAFSPTSGLIAGLFMAVSPFAVYLSQEARHYTLPMLLITLALWGLIQIQQDLEHNRFRFGVWLLWVIINSIGLYVHYFFALAFISQISTLILLLYLRRDKILKLPQIYLGLIISTCGVIISFAPWLLVLFQHFNHSETNWLPAPTIIAPLYQTLISWVLMVIAFPVENQTLIIKAICGFLMVVFAVWVGRKVFSGLKLLWVNQTTYLSTLTLISFTVFIWLQLWGISYFLGKDITFVPRYHFVYYPSFCALIAASFSAKSTIKDKLWKNQRSILIFVLVGIISCMFVVSNFMFQKPFQPEKVAQKMNLDSATPLMLIVRYSNYQDVALGLSFALVLEPLRGQKVAGVDHLAFLNQSSDLATATKKLDPLTIGTSTSHLNLWVVDQG